MKSRRILSLLTSVLLLVALLAACGGGASSQAPASTAAASTGGAAPTSTGSVAPAAELAYSQGASDTEIHIGTTYPTSGNWAFIGVPVMDTIKAVVDRTNANGGIGGRTHVLHHYDDEYDPAKGKTLTERLVEEDKVFLLTCMGGNIVAPSLDYLRDYGIPVVNITSGLPAVYRENDPASAVFPVQPSSSTDGKMMLSRLLHEPIFGPNKDEKLPEDTIIGVFHDTSEGGLITADYIRQQAEAEGVTDRVLYEVVTADTYATAIQKFKDAGVGALICCPTDSLGVVAAMSDAGWEVPFMGSYGTSTIQSFTPETYSPNRLCYSTMWADYTTPEAAVMLADIDDALTYNADLDDATREAYKDNNYARAGYAAIQTTVLGLQRLDEMGVDFTWENFITAMESAPFDLGAIGHFDYAGGARLGVTEMSLVEYIVNDAGEGAQNNTRGFESVESIMGK